MKIKIFALTHKKFEVPQDKMYQPLQVGREEKEDLGYLCDNTGDNISAENCYYSELTGLYWIYCLCFLLLFQFRNHREKPL